MVRGLVVEEIKLRVAIFVSHVQRTARSDVVPLLFPASLQSGIGSFLLLCNNLVLLVDLCDELQKLGLLDPIVDLVSQLRPAFLHPGDPFPHRVQLILQVMKTLQSLLLLFDLGLEHRRLLIGQLVLVAEVLVCNLELVHLPRQLLGDLLMQLLLLVSEWSLVEGILPVLLIHLFQQ